MFAAMASPRGSKGGYWRVRIKPVVTTPPAIAEKPDPETA